MNDKMCTTCKHQGEIRLAQNLDVIYKSIRSDETYIHQCYHHSVELFKLGQARFLQKYNPNLMGQNPIKDSSEILQNFYSFSSFR